MNFVERGSRIVAAAAESLPAPRQRRKWPISYRSISVFAVFSDLATILLCGVVPGLVYDAETFHGSGTILHYVVTATVVAVFFISLMRGNDFYSPEQLLDLRAQVGGVTTTWLSVFLFLAGAAFALKIGSDFSRLATFSFAGTGLGLLIAERVFYRALLRRGLSEQRFAGRNAVLITATDQKTDADDALAYNLLKYGVRLRRQFTLPALQFDSAGHELFVSDIVRYLRGSDVDEVIVGADVMRLGDLTWLFSGLRKLPLPVMLVPVGTASDIFTRPSHMVGGSVYIELQREPLGAFERAAKRAIDVVGSLSALILLLPLLTITALLVKLDSPGPILFRQKRCGFNGRPFDILKFRTMSVLEDGPTISQATQSDTRVTRVGRWLRRTSIDELPQFFNVLSGTMSLIGPRPHAMAHDNQFDKVVSNYAFRHHVKPGVTGWAQVNGQRGPTPTPEDIRRRVEYDLWYIDNWSFRLDFLIVIRTFLEVMRGRNAY
jgi:Undecaprenyl-phosphate glucose phosphotransferase